MFWAFLFHCKVRRHLFSVLYVCSCFLKEKQQEHDQPQVFLKDLNYFGTTEESFVCYWKILFLLVILQMQSVNQRWPQGSNLDTPKLRSYMGNHGSRNLKGVYLERAWLESQQLSFFVERSGIWIFKTYFRFLQRTVLL